MGFTIHWQLLKIYSMAQLVLLALAQGSFVEGFMTPTSLPNGSNAASLRTSDQQLAKLIGVSSFNNLGSDWVGIVASVSQLLLVLINFMITCTNEHICACENKYGFAGTVVVQVR